jgi:hypothetical protein
MLRIEARLLIPGDGQPVPDGVVVADGTTISYAGPAAGAPDTPSATVTTAATVMPGLWDCHGHFLGSRFFDLARLPQESIALRAARSARDLVNALNAGITSVREVGGLGVHLARRSPKGYSTARPSTRRARSSAPPAGTATCTATRCPGSPSSDGRTARCGWPTVRRSACGRCASSCGRARG